MSNAVIECLKNHRAIRSFQKKKIEKEVLELCIMNRSINYVDFLSISIIGLKVKQI